MSRLQPIWASEGTAAKLFDMPVKDFRALVNSGHLPNGREIAPGLVRWSVEDLKNIVAGAAIEGMSDVKW